MPDKFASMRAKQQANAARGKFSGKFAALSASKSAADSSASTTATGGGVDGGSTAGTPTITSARKRANIARIERQASLFADLDQAESLTMEILSLASSTVSALSDAASCDADNDSTTTTAAIQTGNENENMDGSSNDSKSRLQSLMMKCDSNGTAFMAKVRKIHSLLSPHADLVVPYRNHAVDISRNNKNEVISAVATSQKLKSANSGLNIPVIPKRAAAGDLQSPTKKQKIDEADKLISANTDSKLNDGAVNERKETRTLNMYAARMEKKLALEKRNTLKELLKIEREDMILLR